jgi:ankyrin repeat protein
LIETGQISIKSLRFSENTNVVQTKGGLMRGRTIAAVLILFAIAFSACTKASTTNQNSGQSTAQQGKTDPNQQDTEGRTALDHAAGNGDVGTVQILLDGGAGVNSRGASGITPLMTASGMGQIEVVKLLLSKGADVNAKTPGNYTALMQAALVGQTEVVKILLDAGADPTVADNGGRTAAKYAEEKAHKDIVDLLKQRTANKK